jgi:hypothetical protein
MLRSMQDLEDYAIRATDGDTGHVQDCYFDDERWAVRYLVVETGSWLSGRKVLISPISIGRPNWTDRVLPVSITQEQVKNSPHIDTEKPVSRQHEISYLGYYGYPCYWAGGGLWGAGAYPNLMMTDDVPPWSAAPRQGDDPHLRSGNAVMHYHIEATDGDIGHVHSLLVDDETWAIRYIVANTSNWWLGHQVLIAPQWINEVRWSDERVSIDLTRQAVKDAPPYDFTARLNREQETSIYKHYERPGYWAAEAKRDEAVPHL